MSDRAEPYLATIGGETNPLAAASRLRAELTASRAHLVLEQIALRARARKKFAAAKHLFFTSVGLEQATDEWIAAYKARRFADDQRVVDFCCGIGGDLMALAERGSVVGVDRDPVSALLARCNVDRHHSFARQHDGSLAGAVTVEVDSASEHGLEPGESWHIDPDRRPSGRRTTRAEFHDPPAEAIDRWRAGWPNGAIKLAPTATLPPHWAGEAELEWISFARECRQLVAWFGCLARDPSRRRATRIDRDGGVRSLIGAADIEAPVATTIGRYVFEPDTAVLAAKLTGSLAEELGLAAIAAGASYLTADVVVSDRLLAGFAVLEVMPLDTRRLKKSLRQRGIGRLEVKKRGLPHDPQAVARELKVPGENSATLLLARCGTSAVAILAERIAADEAGG